MLLPSLVNSALSSTKKLIEAERKSHSPLRFTTVAAIKVAGFDVGSLQL
jgi:hypothetical protein